MKNFAAPWSKLLVGVSAVSSVICLVVFMIPTMLPVVHHGPRLTWMWFLGPALLIGAALFVVRGYTITQDALLIRRLFWDTRVPLAGLRSAEFVPSAMSHSIRVCGNGGLFSFTGWYRNSELGMYRAYVTDLKNTVVLRFASRRAIVVSPGDPQAFLASLQPAG